MSAGLHRFLVSWVSLFFLSDDRLHSICARAIRTSYGPERSASSARPPSIGVELYLPARTARCPGSPCGRDKPSRSDTAFRAPVASPPGYAKFPRLPVHGVCAAGVPPALGLRPRGGSGRLCFFSRRAARRVRAFAETRG